MRRPRRVAGEYDRARRSRRCLAQRASETRQAIVSPTYPVTAPPPGRCLATARTRQAINGVHPPPPPAIALAPNRDSTPRARRGQAAALSTIHRQNSGQQQRQQPPSSRACRRWHEHPPRAGHMPREERSCAHEPARRGPAIQPARAAVASSAGTGHIATGMGLVGCRELVVTETQLRTAVIGLQTDRASESQREGGDQPRGRDCGACGGRR